jgi:hypothetical protein
MLRAIIVTVVFVVFTVYSFEIALDRGFLEAFTIPLQGGWSGQEFLDLVISMFFAGTWMRRDAREKGLPFVPFVIACATLGSVGLLAYATLSAWVAVKRAKQLDAAASAGMPPTRGPTQMA